jgi:transcriptional regulator with XRE-family HTH domain
MEPWEKIRQAREAKGWSQDFLAKQVGISQPAIKKIEDGSTAHSKFLPRIAALLGLDITELDEGLARLTTTPERAPRLLGGVDFPVHASAQGGPGEIIVDANPMEYMARPAPLAHVRGAYGVYVTGTSMEPEFRQGDIALVNPHLPVVSEEAYIFYGEQPGSTRATIKWLRRATSDKWLVSQHNPAPGRSAYPSRQSSISSAAGPRARSSCHESPRSSRSISRTWTTDLRRSPMHRRPAS